MECQVMEFQENSHRGRIFENVTSILQKKKNTERVHFASGQCFFGNKFFSFDGNKIIFLQKLGIVAWFQRKSRMIMRRIDVSFRRTILFGSN